MRMYTIVMGEGECCGERVGGVRPEDGGQPGGQPFRTHLILKGPEGTKDFLEHRRMHLPSQL